MLAAGQNVDNRYIVEGVIGVGGTAVVYRVRHKAFDSLHALKVLSVTSQKIRKRLLLEGKVQNALRHPNLVAVTDIVPDVQGVPGLVMEYIPGPSLAFQHRIMMRKLGRQIFRQSNRDNFLARHIDQFAGWLVRDQLTMVDDCNAVAQLLGLFQIVRGQHNGNPLCVELADELPQLPA